MLSRTPSTVSEPREPPKLHPFRQDLRACTCAGATQRVVRKGKPTSLSSLRTSKALSPQTFAISVEIAPGSRYPLRRYRALTGRFTLAYREKSRSSNKPRGGRPRSAARDSFVFLPFNLSEHFSTSSTSPSSESRESAGVTRDKKFRRPASARTKAAASARANLICAPPFHPRRCASPGGIDWRYTSETPCGRIYVFAGV